MNRRGEPSCLLFVLPSTPRISTGGRVCRGKTGLTLGSGSSSGIVARIQHHRRRRDRTVTIALALAGSSLEFFPYAIQQPSQFAPATFFHPSRVMVAQMVQYGFNHIFADDARQYRSVSQRTEQDCESIRQFRLHTYQHGPDASPWASYSVRPPGTNRPPPRGKRPGRTY